MTTLPEPSFLDRDGPAILRESIERFEALAGRPLEPSQVERVLIDLIAYRELLVRIAVQEAAKYQREQSRALMATALDSIKKGGMQVTELSPAEMAKFREKDKPVIAKHSATVGEATVAEMMAELDKLRK